MLKTGFKISKGNFSTNPKYMQIMRCIDISGKKVQIQKLADGTEYFVYPNPYNREGAFKHTYVRRVGDAIKVVQEHKADCLLSAEGLNIVSDTAEAIIFLNRKQGEFYHKKALERVNGLTVGYQLEYGNRSMGITYTPVDKQGNICIYGIGTPCIYSTEKEAQVALGKYLAKTKRLITKAFTTETPDLSVIFKASVPKVIQDMASDMIIDRGTGYEIRSDLSNIDFEIVQTVV